MNGEQLPVTLPLARVHWIKDQPRCDKGVEIQNGVAQSSQLAKRKAIFWSNKKADEMEKYCFALRCQRSVYLRVASIHLMEEVIDRRIGKRKV